MQTGEIATRSRTAVCDAARRSFIVFLLRLNRDNYLSIASFHLLSVLLCSFNLQVYIAIFCSGIQGPILKNTNVRSGTFGAATYKTACRGEQGTASVAGQVCCIFDATATHAGSVLDGHSVLSQPCSRSAIEPKKQTC
jgi:hypothetical protein